MRGKVVSWNDDRGFGFIQPEDHSGEVFFHISAVHNAARRPQNGDAVEFDSTRDKSGRLKAAWVRLDGVAPPTQAPRRARGPHARGNQPRHNPMALFKAAALLVVVFVGWLLTQGPLHSLLPSPSSQGSSGSVQVRAEAPIQREIDKTLALIKQGGPFPHSQDGIVFQNRERQLPAEPRGYYREYTVRTPGLSHRGPRRIVTGGNPPVIFYYTEDHYRSFRVLEKQP
ncbi:ribonuclease domain-containing protein [Geopseudomonas aromaticivorans]